MNRYRRTEIGKESLVGGLTHSQKLAKDLEKLINFENDLKHCIDIEEKIYYSKSFFVQIGSLLFYKNNYKNTLITFIVIGKF